MVIQSLTDILHISATCRPHADPAQTSNPPAGYCGHTGAIYEYKDCDGDGVIKIIIHVVLGKVNKIIFHINMVQPCCANQIIMFFPGFRSYVQRSTKPDNGTDRNGSFWCYSE